jgi:hypothetical protein
MVMFELANGHRKKTQRLLLDFPVCSSKETNGYGRIVNITSPVGLYGNFGPETRLGLPLIIIGVFSHDFFVNHHVTYVDHHVNHHVTLIILYICPAEHGNFGYPLRFVSVGL